VDSLIFKKKLKSSLTSETSSMSFFTLILSLTTSGESEVSREMEAVDLIPIRVEVKTLEPCGSLYSLNI